MSKNKTKSSHIWRNTITLILLVIGAIILAARFIGTKGLITKEYIIENPRLSTSFNGLKIVHFTDLHYGTTIFLPEVERLVKEINGLKPDLIFFTGDLIDSGYLITDQEISALAKALNQLNPNVATYAIRGNHDLISDYDKLIEILDFKLLSNNHELFYYNDLTPMVIVGLDDFYSASYHPDEAFKGLEETNYYTILLAHEPDIIDDILDQYQVDLFLAGHSHNGQVRIPFVGSIIKAPGAKVYYDERYELGTTQIFISGGLGTSNYPFRLFNKPSFNLYRFFAE